MRAFAVRVFLLVGVVCYLLIVLFSRPFFSIFNPHDTALIEFTQSRSLGYFSGFFLAGYNILMISYWQSTRRTATAMAVSLSRSVIWPPVLIALLPLAFGREAIWVCHSLSEVLTACTAFVLLRRDGREKDPGVSRADEPA